MQLAMRITLLALLGPFASPAEELVCENDALRLVVNSRSAAWRVVDKRAGHTWRAGSPRRMVAYALPRCGTPVTIDGHLSDWQWLGGAGTPVERVTAGAPVAGKTSPRFRAAWDESCIYFALEVDDPKFIEPPSPEKFWLGDSVELWVGGDQFGVGTVGGKPFVRCYNRPAATKGAKAAITMSRGGWTCEAALALVSLTATAARRQPTALAVGVNDAEVHGQRQLQRYYPSTWVQWDTSTYVLARFVAKPSQRAGLAEAPAPVRCTAARRSADGRAIVLDMPGLVGRDSPAKVTFTLAPSQPEVLVEIDAASGAAMSTCAFPGPLAATTEHAAWVVPSQEGLLYRVRGDRYPIGSFRSMMCMPWIGAADLKTGLGYMIIAETPDDMHFDKQVVRVDGEKLPVGSPLWLAQKGKFGQARRARYAFFHKGGYVAMCKRYRQHAQDAGIVRTLAEKARDVPNVRKLAGAVDVWYSGRGSATVQIAKLLRSLGVDRCLMHISSVGYRPPKATVAALHELGYLVGHYDIYTDLHESGHPWDKWDRYAQYRFPEPVIRKSDGSLQGGWYTVYDQGKPYRSYVVCPIRGLEAMRQRVPNDHAATGHSVWFVDCATSCGFYECYHADHPATRTQDREAKLGQFRFLHDRGLVCGSEGGRDWALRYASYFEGIMGTATWAAAPKNMGRVTGPLDVTEKYMEFDHGPSRRVPLWELVHHDAALVTWWWGDGQLRVPENWWLKDLWQILYGNMPLWMMRQSGEKLFIENVEAFRASYARVSPVTRAVFGVEMLSHEFLSDDCALQRTHWANGLTVTVNFGEAPCAIGDMPAMPGRSYRLDGDAARLPNLPLGKAVVMPYAWKPKVSKGMLNADFAAGTLGWSSTKGISLSVVQAAHDGKHAAQFTGKNERDWTLGRNAATFALQPGKRYRFGAWTKLAELEPRDQPPWLALTVNGEKGWITNVHTPRYDAERMGTWQLLQAAFVCPPGGDSGSFNIEKHSKLPISITLLLSRPFFEEAGQAAQGRGQEQ